jgi:hypothetical protein
MNGTHRESRPSLATVCVILSLTVWWLVYVWFGVCDLQAKQRKEVGVWWQLVLSLSFAFCSDLTKYNPGHQARYC